MQTRMLILLTNRGVCYVAITEYHNKVNFINRKNRKEVNFCMPAQWTGELVGKLHNHNLSCRDLAKELEVTPAYVSMVLHGKKNPSNAEQRFTEAVQALIEHTSKEE